MTLLSIRQLQKDLALAQRRIRELEKREAASDQAAEALEDKLSKLEGSIAAREEEIAELRTEAESLEELLYVDLPKLAEVVVLVRPEWRSTKVDIVTGEGAVKAAIKYLLELPQPRVFVAGLSGPSQEQADRRVSTPRKQVRAKVIAATPRKHRKG